MALGFDTRDGWLVVGARMREKAESLHIAAGSAADESSVAASRFG